MKRWFLSLACMALAASAPVRPGNLDVRWIHGAPDEAPLQVHRYAEGFWILREGKAVNFEAPFLYLIAGRERALLLDTGAGPAMGTSLPLRETVDRLLSEREKALGHPLELVVAHSHGHRDHTWGDALFRDRPRTTVVEAKPEAVAAFFGLKAWPEGEASLELGGRTLAVLPLPGHEPAHIAVYDPATGALLSGDTLYPGLLTIRDWPASRRSAARLGAFARAHAVSHVLGAHVEMTKRPGEMYPLETAFQPEEHGLALGPEHIAELERACAALGDFRHEDRHRDFILGRVPTPSGDKPSTHGMLVVGGDRVFLSHLPMFHSPHDYQALLEVRLPAAALAAYRADLKAGGERVYTLAPTETWVLPDRLLAGKAFKADLYRGHFERGGKPLAEGIEVALVRLVHLRKFEAGLKARPGAWIRFGGGAFLAHRIEGTPDFDQVAEVSGPGGDGDLELPAAGPLKDGQALGALKVGRVLYTEFGDLKD